MSQSLNIFNGLGHCRDYWEVLISTWIPSALFARLQPLGQSSHIPRHWIWVLSLFRGYLMRKTRSTVILGLFALTGGSDACAYWNGTKNVPNNYWHPLAEPIIQGLSTLSDLNLDGPFTYVETFSSPAPDCATDPATVTEWRTAYIDETAYYALPTSYTLQVVTETFYVTYTYPDLILTLLKPGDVIYQVLESLIISNYSLSYC